MLAKNKKLENFNLEEIITIGDTVRLFFWDCNEEVLEVLNNEEQDFGFIPWYDRGLGTFTFMGIKYKCICLWFYWETQEARDTERKILKLLK